jgi:hypothetical protein
MMNRIRTSQLLVYALALLSFFVAIAPGAMAKLKHEAPTDSVTVVAHLPLPGVPVSQLFLQGHGSKQYLYIQQASEEGFTIVDISKPSRPNIVNLVNLPNKVSGETLQMVGAGLAIAEAPGAGTEKVRDEQFVRLLDLSDPVNPRTLQTFDTVSSTLLDDGQNLVYITNSEGLWILRYNVPTSHPLCDSEIRDDANCYAY